MILVLGPILAAAQREQLSEDSFTTNADEYDGQKYHDEGETGSQKLSVCNLHLLGICDMVVVVTSHLLRICQYLSIRYWGSYSLSIPGGSGSGNAVKVTKNVNQDQCDKRKYKNM